MNRNYSNAEQKIRGVLKCNETEALEVDNVLTDRQIRLVIYIGLHTGSP